MARPVDTPTAADFFCGGGGASEGVIGAGVKLRFAANHDAVAMMKMAATASRRGTDMCAPW